MLKTKIADIELNTCIYNAAGVNCTSKEELKELSLCPYTAAVITKSITLYSCLGNAQPRFYQNRDVSINSTGLANYGYDYYIFHDFIGGFKPYIISVAATSHNDTVSIFKKLNIGNNVSAIELNLSCPNLDVDNSNKSLIGYNLIKSDVGSVNELLRKIFDVYQNKTAIGLKLPPYLDYNHFDQMVDIIKEYPKIKFITCINSLGNGLIIDPKSESVVLKPRKGFGGIGGSFIKPIALSNVHRFYQLLGNKIDIIGCGGIKNGIDVFEHILAGASAVQIGSQLAYEGVKCFQRITTELEVIMKEKKYTSIFDYQGKLKYL